MIAGTIATQVNNPRHSILWKIKMGLMSDLDVTINIQTNARNNQFIEEIAGGTSATE
jgi:hypothetical protein